MTYEITIDISPAGVTQINSTLKQYVTLVKSVVASGAQVPVAWVAIPAMEILTISWEEAYYAYAFEETVSEGVTITGFSSTTGQTQVGEQYTFSGGVFDNGTPGPAGTTYGSVNSGGETMTMGLAQYVQVTGMGNVLTPINAMAVGNTESANFEPYVTVSVFLQGYENNGVVISEVTSTAYVVELNPNSTTATLSFNPSNNTFS